MKTKATNTTDYFAELPEERRNALQQLRFILEDGTVAESAIVDFFHRDKAEWRRMKEGYELRLDPIFTFVLLTCNCWRPIQKRDLDRVTPQL